MIDLTATATRRALTLRQMAGARATEALDRLSVGDVAGYRSRSSDSVELLREARRLERHRERIDDEWLRTESALAGILERAGGGNA